MNETVIAAAFTLVGVIGVKFIERLLPPTDQSFNEAARIRAELRTDVNKMETQIISLRGEVDTWREKYFTLLGEVTLLRGRMTQIEKVQHS